MLPISSLMGAKIDLYLIYFLFFVYYNTAGGFFKRVIIHSNKIDLALG
jgi:hypothetical protein